MSDPVDFNEENRIFEELMIVCDPTSADGLELRQAMNDLLALSERVARRDITLSKKMRLVHSSYMDLIEHVNKRSDRG